MIVHAVVQGTPEWLAVRLGIPTASRFAEILTPVTRVLSKSARQYAVQLVTERLMGQPLDDWSGAWAERGTGMEAEARKWYEFERGVTVQQVGFVTLDDGSAGCSPDGLVGDDGLVEIKCRSAEEHMKAVLGLAEIAEPTQVQGQLWITGRQWCDVIAYCPGLPRLVRRVKRDEAYIADLSAAVAAFGATMKEMQDKLTGLLDGRAPGTVTLLEE